MTKKWSDFRDKALKDINVACAYLQCLYDDELFIDMSDEERDEMFKQGLKNILHANGVELKDEG